MKRISAGYVIWRGDQQAAAVRVDAVRHRFMGQDILSC